MVSANCGVPVTNTGSLKATVAAITSPARKTPPAAVAVPEKVTPVTVGRTTSAPFPFTSKFASLSTPWVPRPKAALVLPCLMVPPFNSNFVTLIPLVSLSSPLTV